MLTGFDDLDLLTSGFFPGDLVFMVGRTQMGKTAFAYNVVVNTVRADHAAIIFSLEMNRPRAHQRLLPAAAQIPSWELSSGNVRTEDWPKLVRGIAELSQWSLWIDDSSNDSFREIREKVRLASTALRHTGQPPLALLVFDYLQLMVPTARDAEGRRRHIFEIVKGLKLMARDLDISVLVTAQLDPLLYQRYDKRPALSDLGELDCVQQIADTVMFLHRDEYYNPDSANKGIAEIIVSKHRNGPTGRIQLAWLPQYGKFASLARRSAAL